MKDNYDFIKRKYSEYIRDITSLGNPIILVLISLLVYGFSWYLLLILIGMAINELIGSGIKFFFHKKRPNGQTYKTKLEKIDAGSFPSIHSSRVSFVFLMLIKNSTYPLSILLFSFILIIGYSRIFLKKHDYIDVIGGYSLGVLLYYLVNSGTFLIY